MESQGAGGTETVDKSTFETLQSKVTDLQEKLAHEKAKTEQMKALENKGKNIDDVSKRHARRKLNEFTTKAEQVLWFAESFGLELDSIQAHTLSGREVKIQLSKTAGSSVESDRTQDSNKMKEILYLLDKFGVGDQYYHEMSMLDSSLPRSYKVKGLRTTLNESMDIKHISGFEGARRPFKETLTKVIRRMVCYYITLPTS